MIIKNAVFVSSIVKINDCPPDTMPEYALIGRSNVGKSSLINMLLSQKGLAKTSGTPGKTQTINHFLVNGAWYMVDLPGYGYARISHAMREKWQKMIKDYLKGRDNLQCVFILIDSRISPQKNDLNFVNWLGSMQIPFVIVFTKSDDKKFSEKNIHLFKTTLLTTWEALPPIYVTSAETKRGRDDLLNFIENINNQFFENKG